MQLYAPDDGWGDAQNMLSHYERRVINSLKTVASGWLTYLNCMMMHGLANVKCRISCFEECSCKAKPTAKFTNPASSFPSAGIIYAPFSRA
jgi:hypothetical protein